MKRERVMALALTLVLAVAAGMAGCSKSSSPTAPVSLGGNNGGGGGGGGGMGGGGGGGGGGMGGGGADMPFDSGALTGPAAFQWTFPTPGTVPYHCQFHASLGMVGTVVVSSTATDSVVTVTAQNYSFTPGTVTIKPGGVVHWNIMSGTHTVTSGAYTGGGGGGGYMNMGASTRMGR